jgi:hypothetical protein
MADVPITELLMSPRWAVTVGDIDGTPHVVLRIQHPRLGPLDFLLPKNDPIELAAALEKTWERRDEARMRRAAVQADPNVEAIQSPRQTQSSWWSRLLRSESVVTSKFITTNSIAKEKRSKRST